jgi:alkanesulfonate monooxygenase SsuD/methylene tetrahydromethanopterin reductase-like flavin-dependent oxidoreductase (luciferase family)
MTMPIHIGALLPTHAVPPGGEIVDVRRSAQHAEQIGLDSVWAGDHLTTGFPLLESTVGLTAAAAVTDRIMIGYSVMLLALRHPAWAAKQIASLQYVSGNRLLLGVGVGGVSTPNEWQAAGVASRGRARRTDLILTALPGLLSGQPTALATEPDEPVVTLSPAVPMPPVWIGGTSDAALVRTVTHGHGWLAAMLTPNDLAHRADLLTTLAGQRGEPRPQIGIMIFATLTERDSKTAAAPVASYLTGAYGLDPAYAEALAIGGSPEQVAERLAAYLAAGVSKLVIVPFGPDVLTQYDLIAQARSLLLGRQRT